MTKLIFHVGDCKSGSTAIQSVLQAGSYTLADPDAKILYPEAGRRGALNHHRLSNALYMPQAMKWQAKAWGALAEEIASLKPAAAIVSSERFEFADPNALATVLTKHFGTQQPDIHIVIYVRPHIERIVSGYVQNVKQGLFDADMSAFLDQMATEGRFAFAPRLTRWMSVFDHAKVTIRPMIRAELHNRCVVSDLLTLAASEIGTTAAVTSIPYGNASLSAPALELTRGLWAKVRSMADAQRSSTAAVMARITRGLEEADPFDGQPNRIAKADAQRAQAIYAEDARSCDVKVFQRAVMGPALNAAVEKAPAVIDPPALSAEAQALSALWLDAASEPPAKSPDQKRRNRPSNAQWRGTQT